MKTAKKINVLHQCCKFVVERLCKDLKTISWGKELKIAKQLLKKYPNMDFWEAIPIFYKPYTLSYYLTEEGGNWLRKQYNEFNLQLPEIRSYHLDNTVQVVNNPVEVNNKPKNLVEFLNNK